MTGYLCLLDLFREMEGGHRTVNIAWTFLGGLLLGCSNTKERGDHRNNKSFINKSVKACTFERVFHCGGKIGFQIKNFVWSRKTTFIVCIGISTPTKNTIPSSLAAPPPPPPPPHPPTPLFSGNFPIYIGFSWPLPLKIGFFSEHPQHWNFSSLTPSLLLKSN